MISTLRQSPILKIGVLHVIIGLNVGGAETMLSRLVSSFDDSPNYKHCVVSLTDLGTIGPKLQARGLKVYSLGMRSAMGIPVVFWKLYRLMRLVRPDIVQTWMYHADLLGGLAGRMAGIKGIIWGVRTTDVNTAGYGGTALVRRACALLSRFVPRFIVCAAEASRIAHVCVGYDASRMMVIPNGFQLDRFVPMEQARADLRIQCGFSASSVVVGYLGRFHSDKDQANFVRAAGMAASIHPNVVFLMVGQGLNAANVELQRWINESGHTSRFVLLGLRSDVPECLSAMDLFCLSSRTEGFPNVVGEAMAMGLPCVVTDVGDAAMLVADTGVVVPKEDSVALAKGLGKLLVMSATERRRLGQKAKARIHSEFSMVRAYEQFAALYDQMTRE